MFLTGCMMLLAILTYGVVTANDPPLRIIFPDNILRPKFNYAFYLTLITGIFTTILACIILLMNFLYPRKVAKVFHHGLIADDSIFEVSGSLANNLVVCLHSPSPSIIHYNCYNFLNS